MKITRSMIVPTCGGINKPGRVQFPDALRQLKFGEVIRDLAPAFVVDDPGNDAWMIAQLVIDDLELPAKLGLLIVRGTVMVKHTHRRHVLHDEQAHPVACLVEHLGLYLDVLAHHVHAQLLDQL